MPAPERRLINFERWATHAEADAYEKRLDPGAANVSANQDRLREALDYRLKDSPRYKVAQYLSGVASDQTRRSSYPPNL